MSIDQLQFGGKGLDVARCDKSRMSPRGLA
jgi:hypothetical protein